MADLHPSAQAVNVVGSIQHYFDEQVSDVLNSSQSIIDYGGGQAFRDTNLPEWLQLRTMAAVAIGDDSYAPRTEDSEPTDRAREVYWLVNVNCFVRPGLVVPIDNLRLWRMRDTVLTAMRVGLRIPVKDYAGASTTLGFLFVTEVLEDRAIQDPARIELVQHNLVFALRWSETWGVG
jgi:hypothetical protein